MRSSVLLRAARKPIFTLQIVFSFYFLLRGHNSPGGGFIAGLLAAASFAFYAIAVDVSSARRMMWISSPLLMALGLLVSVSSGIIAVLHADPYMTGVWRGAIPVPFGDDIKLGTPLLFDIGVYLVVIGMTTLVVFSLFERGGPRSEPETPELQAHDLSPSGGLT